jgi:myosin heavy subunit
MLSSMAGLNFSKNEIDGIFRITSAVIQLSKVEFQETGQEGSKFTPINYFAKNVAELLGIDLGRLEEICCINFLHDPMNNRKKIS